MQKQKINYLTLQSTYDQIEVGIFNQTEQTDLLQISKFAASAELIPGIKNKLANHNLILNDLNFICANLGPAPFTTLRTTIVTVNGLGYATGIPLVGINGLELFAKTTLPQAENLIIILNAYGKSVYYAIRTAQKIIYGWEMLNQFMINIENMFNNQSVYLIGHLDLLATTDHQLGTNFILAPNHAAYPDLKLIAQAGLDAYQNKLITNELSPLYLKQAEPLK